MNPNRPYCKMNFRNVAMGAPEVEVNSIVAGHADDAIYLNPNKLAILVKCACKRCACMPMG